MEVFLHGLYLGLYGVRSGEVAVGAARGAQGAYGLQLRLGFGLVQ